jgi:hypothetical protein
MFRLLEAIFRLNIKECVYILQCRKMDILLFYIQPEDGFVELKHVAINS